MYQLRTEQDIINLIAKNLNSETEILEFKEAKTQYSSLWWERKDKNCIYGYCVGIGNMWWWILLLWVDDRGNICGSKAELLPKIKTKIYELTNQHIDIQKITTTKWEVIVIAIPGRSMWQYFEFYGTALMRIDDGLRVMDQQMIKNILMEWQPDWSEQIIPEAVLDDLDPNAIAKARHEFSIKYADKISQYEIDNRSDEMFLNKAKLTKKWKITRTALILLWKEESDSMIAPWTSKISWILRDRDGIEKDYEHFFAPLILNVDRLYNKIRKLKYRYIKWNSLFPEETDMYDSYVLREMIYNAIAHQDYSLWGKINIIEYEDKIVISNQGSFLPWSVEQVIMSDSPSERYRNSFLANAMVSLRMIDTIWSGIKKSFTIQKDKFFPLPDYEFDNHRVQVTIYGTILDVNYARKLADIPWLSLSEIISLDKIQKQKPIDSETAKYLKSKWLIEGNRPNLYISAVIAWQLNERTDYIKQRWFKDSHYKNLILEYLTKYKVASKKDIDNLILDILPSILDKKQKENKVKNIVYAMSKKDQTIINAGTNRNPIWKKIVW